MSRHLKTVAEVIAELGGPENVAEITKRGASPSMVPTWKYRKQFPAKTFTTIQAALKARRLSAPNSLWGMP